MARKKKPPEPPGGEFWPYPCFLGLSPEHSGRKRSKVVVLPLPYEGTTSYGAGTRFGPQAIVDASKELEFYDRTTGTEAATELGFHTMPPVFPDFSGPRKMIDAVSSVAAGVIRSGKFLLSLGGEHSVTVGLVRAAARRWRDLCIVQVDAHADLRPSYEGTRYSHACSMRRCLAELPAGGNPRLIQVGIRNVSEEGNRFRKSRRGRLRTLWAEDILADSRGRWLEAVAELVGGRPVYLTVDLDGLDPSIMPATGTPEPGGLLWQHAVGLVECLAAHGRLVAAALVELAPQPANHAPDYLAAKLAYLIARRALRK
ncbi:MAG: agmatinase [Planctomycetota bacterium]